MAKLKKSTKTPFYKTGPLYLHGGEHDEPGKPSSKVKEAKEGEVPGLQEIQKRFEGKYKVTPKKGKYNEYTLTDKGGGSVSYSAGPRVKRDKTTLAQAINKSME